MNTSKYQINTNSIFLLIQNRKFTGLSKELTVHDKETNGITPIIKVVNAQDRSFTEQPSSQLQHHKSDHRTPSVSAYFFSTNSNKPSYHHLHHDNNNAYVFSINDPRFLEQLKRLRSQQKSLKKLPKRKKPKSTLTCRGLFGEVIPGCKPRRHRKNPQRKPPKTSIVQGYDILKGGVFTPKSTLTDRVSHLVPQTESFQHPLLPPNTIPLSQAEQSLLRYGPRIWRPVYQVPMANKYPVYSRRQMKTMHHHGISPHGHPAWKRGQLDNFRMQTSLNSQLFKSSHFSPILSTRIYMNTT